MRGLIVGLALFLYVSMDITVNHGATVHGWLSFFSAMARTVGL
jgi:hypothetical protein